MNRERRAFEFRAVDDGGAVLVGTAMPYNSRGQVGRFTESFIPGSLSYDDVLVNVEHRADRILTRSGAGLTLTETPDALMAAIRLPDTSEGRDVRELVSQRVIRGLSIEFRCKRERWEGTHRSVLAAHLDALAVCCRPAYAGATIGEAGEMRSEDHLFNLQGAPRIRRWRYL